MSAVAWSAGTLAGHALDRLLGEAPAAVHPVALAGRALARLEHRTYRPTRPAGSAHLLVAVGGATAVGVALGRVAGPAAGTAVAVAVASAGRMLGDEAEAVGRLLAAGHVDEARQRLPALVGRDPADLDEAGIVRAVVESVAENTVDAVTATLWWGHATGPVGVCVHRTVNTLDAMVGHRTARYERFGWASARVDDALGYVPARLTALAVAVASPRRARAVLRAVRRDAGRHPSPNGGIVEAAFAGALGVTLGGVNRYGDRVEDRGRLGTGPAPTVDTISRAVGLGRRASAVVAVAPALVTLVSLVVGRVRRRRRR